MIKLYKEIWYPEKKEEITDRSVVDILTDEERSSLWQGYYDEHRQDYNRRLFGINYAHRKGDRSPVLRGFEFDGKLYEIDADNKRLIVQAKRGLFYDADKIPVSNQFVFEGTGNDFIQEFVKAGYKI